MSLDTERHEPELGGLLVGAEVKQDETLGEAETQELCYLADMWKIRKDAGKKVCSVGGICGSGSSVRFMTINEEGVVRKTKFYHFNIQEELAIIYSSTRALLKLAILSSPETTPLISREEQEAFSSKKIDGIRTNLFTLRSENKSISGNWEDLVYSSGEDDGSITSSGMEGREKKRPREDADTL